MAKNSFAEHETKIKESLFDFMKQYIPNFELDLIDEIVLSYVVAILENASSEPVFDVEGFSEMMSAYFPEFESINHGAICDWIFNLETKLRTKEENTVLKLNDLSISDIINEIPQIKTKPQNVDLNFDFDEKTNKRIHHMSETSDSSGSNDSTQDFFPEEVDILQEMFPDVYSLEVKHCLAIANGDIDRATQILLHRQENGLSLTNGAIITHVAQKSSKIVNDNELKSRIIARYSYVDKDSDKREHKPLVPKDEPKKLVRYRDSKIVSLRGERYTEVKKGEDCEELSAKKQAKQKLALLRSEQQQQQNNNAVNSQNQHNP